MRLSLACSPASVRAPPNNPNFILALSSFLRAMMDRSTRRLQGYPTAHPNLPSPASEGGFGCGQPLFGRRHQRWRVDIAFRQPPPGLAQQLLVELFGLCRRHAHDGVVAIGRDRRAYLAEQPARTAAL